MSNIVPIREKPLVEWLFLLFKNVRIVGDTSSVEVFVNDGALVVSTRTYPEAYGATVDAPGASVTYHTLSI